MRLWEAVIYGIVQGLTEFLPVSSSGHITLLGRIFGTPQEVMQSFTTMLHVGTLIAVFMVMWKEIKAILKDLAGLTTRLLIVATIPAVLFALLFSDWIEKAFGHGASLGFEFLITGIILLSVFLVRGGEQKTTIGYREAAIAGAGQAVAILPAISRSGATIAALLHAGVARDAAIRFSFLMAVPAILGGFILDVYGMVRSDTNVFIELGVFNVIVGVVLAGVFGWLAMRWMIRRLTRRGFLYCAFYVIGLGTLILCDQQVTRWVFR